MNCSPTNENLQIEITMVKLYDESDSRVGRNTFCVFMWMANITQSFISSNIWKSQYHSSYIKLYVIYLRIVHGQIIMSSLASSHVVDLKNVRQYWNYQGCFQTLAIGSISSNIKGTVRAMPPAGLLFSVHRSTQVRYSRY